MTTEQAQQLIDLTAALNETATAVLFLVQVTAVCAVWRVGQAMIERVLLSKNSKKIW